MKVGKKRAKAYQAGADKGSRYPFTCNDGDLVLKCPVTSCDGGPQDYFLDWKMVVVEIVNKTTHMITFYVKNKIRDPLDTTPNPSRRVSYTDKKRIVRCGVTNKGKFVSERWTLMSVADAIELNDELNDIAENSKQGVIKL